MVTLERPIVLELRWRAWEAAARKLAGNDERAIRRWVALRWWYQTRQPMGHR